MSLFGYELIIIGVAILIVTLATTVPQYLFMWYMRPYEQVRVRIVRALYSNIPIRVMLSVFVTVWGYADLMHAYPELLGIAEALRALCS